MASTASGPLAPMTSAIGERVLERRAVGDHPADQADLLGLLGRHLPGGEQEVHGHGERDLAPQPDRGAAQREQAPLGLEDAELGPLAGHPDVGGLEDLGAAGHRPTLDRGDQRLLQRSSGAGAPSSAGRGRRPSAAFTSSLPGPDIDFRSMPAQNVPPAPVRMAQRMSSLPVDLDPGVGHADQHRTRECVLRLGAVHGDDGGRPDDLEVRCSVPIMVLLPSVRTAPPCARSAMRRTVPWTVRSAR